jgi:hypothetical protein
VTRRRRRMKRSKWEEWCYQGFDYGGQIARHLGLGVFHIIDFMNWEETTGEKAVDGCKYLVELNMVDVLAVDPRTLNSALHSCGSDYIEEAKGRERYIYCAEALHSYGNKARLGMYEGNDGNMLIRCAKADSHRLEKDKDALEDRLDQQANAIGNTYRQFMSGTWGFKPASEELHRGPRTVLREYIRMLEHHIAARDKEIQELKQKLGAETLEAHGDQRLVQPGSDMRQ